MWESLGSVLARERGGSHRRKTPPPEGEGPKGHHLNPPIGAKRCRETVRGWCLSPRLTSALALAALSSFPPPVLPVSKGCQWLAKPPSPTARPLIAVRPAMGAQRSQANRGALTCLSAPTGKSLRLRSDKNPTNMVPTVRVRGCKPPYARARNATVVET